MYVDHNNKYVFIHVPRTGGFSFYAAMSGTRIDTHATLNEANKIYEIQGYFSFGFIRNPWDRLFSCYRKHRATWKRKPIKKHKFASKGFKHYLLNGYPERYKPAMHWLSGCKFIGKYEQLEEEYNYIFRMIGINKPCLPKIHSVDYEDYRPYFDNEMVEFVYKHHKTDIERGGYVFE